MLIALLIVSIIIGVTGAAYWIRSRIIAFLLTLLEGATDQAVEEPCFGFDDLD